MRSQSLSATLPKRRDLPSPPSEDISLMAAESNFLIDMWDSIAGVFHLGAISSTVRPGDRGASRVARGWTGYPS
jgi:hypothetical protein